MKAKPIDPDEMARKLANDIAERNGWIEVEDSENAEKEAGEIVAFLRKTYPEHFSP